MGLGQVKTTKRNVARAITHDSNKKRSKKLVKGILTRNEIENLIISFLIKKNELNKHEKYIMGVLTYESNNKNYLSYKLEALIDLMIEMKLIK